MTKKKNNQFYKKWHPTGNIISIVNSLCSRYFFKKGKLHVRSYSEQGGRLRVASLSLSLSLSLISLFLFFVLFYFECVSLGFFLFCFLFVLSFIFPVHTLQPFLKVYLQLFIAFLESKLTFEYSQKQNQSEPPSLGNS